MNFPIQSIQATDTTYKSNFNKPKKKEKKLQRPHQDYDYYKELKKNKTVQKVNKEIVKNYSRLEAARDTLLTVPFGINIDYNGPFISNYSLSFWVYFNTLTPLTGVDKIMSFGSKPSLFFDHKHNELIIKAIDNSNKTEILYRTKEILFQRWNHFVVNFDNSKLHLFINNNLVGFYNTTPFIQSNDLLMIGSTKNNNVGAVCNFRYYDYPLPLNKIESIYKKYNKKEPPI